MSEQSFIRFNPNQIIEVATNLQLQQSFLTNNMTEIYNRSRALRSSWRSDARANNYYDELERLNTKANDLIQLLGTLSGSLLKSAGYYTVGEENVTQKAITLPVGGVFNN
jgi:WXG100 family type VII secretion target